MTINRTNSLETSRVSYIVSKRYDINFGPRSA